MTVELGQTLTRSDELTRDGRHDEHLALMRDALAWHPGEVEVMIRAGGAHVVDDPEQAAELARGAVRLAPEDPATLTRAASVMFHVARLEEARELLSGAVRGAGDDFVLAFDLAYLTGQLAFAEGDLDNAEQLFRVAFDNRPEAPGHGFALAGLLYDRREHERAQEVVEQALRHRPGDQSLEGLRVQVRVALHGLDALDDLPPGWSVTRE